MGLLKKLTVATDTVNDGVYITTSGGTNVARIGTSSTATSGVLALLAGGSTKVFISAKANENSYFNGGGNVGIGTTSPQQKLDTPNIIISGSSIAASYRANATLMDNLGGVARFYSLGPNTTTGGSYQFNSLSSNATAGSGTVMTILNNGNVGIGTTSPGTINSVAFSGVGLHVKSGTLGRTITEGSSEASYLLNNSGASVNQRIKYIQSTAGNLAIGSFNDNGLARPQITVLNSGNVGIGTTSPGEKLDVAGTNVGIKINGTQSSRVYYNRSGTYTWSTGLRSGDTKFHIFDERSGDRVVIDDTGNVGIGTTSPSQKTSRSR